MPQPLTNLPQVRSYNLGSNMDSPSRTRPQLSLAAMNVIAEWSQLENFVNGLFVKLLGTNAAQAAAIFASIRNSAGQRDAFTAVASVTLANRPADQDLLRAVLEVCDKASKTRNRIAHWVWGYSAYLPDAVLLADPIMMSAWDSKMSDYVAEVCENPRARIDKPEPDKTKIYAYFQRDFDDSSNAIQRAIHLVGHFSRYLSGGVIAEELPPLANEPEIRPILNRYNRHRETD